MPETGLQVTGAILAGGQGRRMQGRDKGLLQLQGTALVEHVIHLLAPQVDQICISANRSLQQYRSLGYPVVQDETAGFSGPLVGILAVMKQSRHELIQICACDAPFIPPNLVQRLHSHLMHNHADIAVPMTGSHLQPVHALLRRTLLADLQSALNEGVSSPQAWYSNQNMVAVDFNDRADAFNSINTPEQLEQAQ